VKILTTLLCAAAGFAAILSLGAGVAAAAPEDRQPLIDEEAG
jgi:hypothetical protein